MVQHGSHAGEGHGAREGHGACAAGRTAVLHGSLSPNAGTSDQFWSYATRARAHHEGILRCVRICRTPMRTIPVESIPAAGEFSLMLRTSTLLLFWAGAIASLAAQFAIVRSVVSGRAHAPTDDRAVRWREIAWVVIPALALLGVLVATWMKLERVMPVMPGALS